jgi:predicted ATPase
MRVVITGGPCSGKTTLIEELAARGYQIAPEAAILVISALNQELGVEGQKDWRRQNLAEFQCRVLQTQLELEEQALSSRKSEQEPVFFDRGCIDGLAYCKYFQTEPPTALCDAAKDASYDQVFVLDTLDDFQERSEEGRTSDQSTSIALGALLEETYRDHGYAPIRVKVASVGERADFILAALR